ncbi:MAG TPA: MFS transporter [Steroidobacteraceae bacterium]|nr:MFS transporter [Steroidobacteraceae bacterium]
MPRLNIERPVLLVTLAVFINYVDRGNLATAAPLIQDQLGLTATQLGLLGSAFYYAYVPLMPAAGWLAEHAGPKRVLAAGMVIWSAATALSGFAGGFVALLLLRLLLGLGESVAFPAATKVVAATIPLDRLGIANGFMSFGYLIGPAVGTAVGGYLMGHIGWRAVFLLFGLASLLWLWPWQRMALPSPSPSIDRPATPSFAAILSQRALWGAALGHFAANYTYYFIIAWLPFYLVRVRGFSITAMAATASWAYLLNAASALAMGALTDRWLRAGRDSTSIYKPVMGLAQLGSFGCMTAMILLPPSGSVAALLAFEVIAGCSYPGLFAIPQTFAGPDATGRWVGVQNACGNVAGMIAPVVTGLLVDRTGGFDAAFVLAAVVSALGFAGWVWILPRVAPIDWSSTLKTG